MSAWIRIYLLAHTLSEFGQSLATSESFGDMAVTILRFLPLCLTPWVSMATVRVVTSPFAFLGEVGVV